MGDQLRPGFSDKQYGRVFEFFQTHPLGMHLAPEEVARMGLFFMYWACTAQDATSQTPMEIIIEERYAGNSTAAYKDLLLSQLLFKQRHTLTAYQEVIVCQTPSKNLTKAKRSHENR
jgi:hypothetical protein